MSSLFDDYIANTDLIRTIEQYWNVEIRRGKNIVCQFHNDDKPSFSVYDNGTRWKCFGCGKSGDVLEFVHLVTGMSKAEIVGGTEATPAQTRRRLKRAKIKETTKHKYMPERVEFEHLELFSMKLFSNYDAMMFLWSRGVFPGTARREFVGWTGEHDFIDIWQHNKIFIPFFDDKSNVIAYKLRDLSPASSMKWARMGSTEYPYNYYDFLHVTNKFPEYHPIYFIVEAELDALLLRSLFRQNCALAMPTSQFEGATEYLANFSGTFIIIADRDKPGYEAALKFKHQLARTLIVETPIGKDIGEFWQASPTDCATWLYRLGTELQPLHHERIPVTFEMWMEMA